MKKLKFDEEEEKQMREDFENALRTMQGIPSEIKISTHNVSRVAKPEEKATVIFENDAYKKMLALVDNASTEIGWYGVVEKSKTEERTWIVKKILVFPQMVTGATVQTDDLKFIEWQDSLSDEDFNGCRFYGHSHVNFGVTPSGTDETFYNATMQNIPDYYIFGIFNKSRASWFNIYDIENNILYENTDIDFQYYITSDDEWAKAQIKENLSERTYANAYTGLSKKSTSSKFNKKAKSKKSEQNNWQPYSSYGDQEYDDYGDYGDYEGNEGKPAYDYWKYWDDDDDGFGFDEIFD